MSCAVQTCLYTLTLGYLWYTVIFHHRASMILERVIYNHSGPHLYTGCPHRTVAETPTDFISFLCRSKTIKMLKYYTLPSPWSRSQNITWEAQPARTGWVQVVGTWKSEEGNKKKKKPTEKNVNYEDSERKQLIILKASNLAFYSGASVTRHM